MKHFKTVSSTFIIVIAVIFCCNVYYLVSLYGSIRRTVEKDVMSAIADADLDELWVRVECADVETRAQVEPDQNTGQNHDRTADALENSRPMVAQSCVNGETVAVETLTPDKNHSFNNLFSQTLGRQFHSIIDFYIPVNLRVLDSMITGRLNSRSIYPGFVSTEIVDASDNIIHGPQSTAEGNCDVFKYCFNPDKGESYRVSMTPLTRHILTEMAGVIVTVFLLMAAFAMAFLYLFKTISRLRTIEEMKDDFVSNMTHELKTPVAIAYSANDALLNYKADDDHAKRTAYLEIANRQLKRLGELIENILAMSMERRKTIQLKYERINLRPFVEEIAAAQRMRGDKEISVKVDVDDNAEVVSDKIHLANILNNLIDNAIKYSGDSVTIVVRCDRRSISVTDNGIGIPSRSLPYLFDRFYRVHHGNRQDTRGYGIGLYYVKNILDKMGWTISVRSKEGEGSTFNIIFCKDET